MATAIRPPFEPFVYGNSPSTLSSRWEVWLNDYNDFILVNSLDKTEEAARNKAHFRMHVGLEVKQIWATVEDKTEDIGTIQEKLTTQIVGQRSSVNERFKFWTASPSSNETTEKYVLRLRSLAAHCDFESLAQKSAADIVSAMVLWHLIPSCNNANLQRKLLLQPDLTLTKAVQVARGLEQLEDNVTQLASKAEPVSYVQDQNATNSRDSEQRNRFSHRSKGFTREGPGHRSERHGYSSGQHDPGCAKCRNCGHEQHADSSECRARDAECRSCGKIGHYARTCRSKPIEKGHEAKHEARRRPKKGQSDYKSRNGRGINQVNEIYEESDDSFYMVSTGERTRRPLASVEMKGEQVEFLIDTGAPVDIINEATHARLAGPPVLRPCRSTFTGFQSDEALPIVGEFACVAKFRGKQRHTRVLVTKGHARNLLSCATAEALGAVVIMCTVSEQPGDAKEEKAERKGPIGSSPIPSEWLRQRYGNAFSGKLGCLKGFEATIDLDETVKPVRQPLRPTPFHMRPIVAQELLRQVEQGIIEPVNETSGPTPWVANLVCVAKKEANEIDPKKPAEIRLTCDSKPLNKAIRRTRFPFNTIDDLMYSAVGAKYFSKIDVKKAFHQLRLATRCRNLTTIVTHIGLFRYKRLHMGISSASEIFCEAIRVLLMGVPGQLNMCDDILVYGSTVEEHDRSLFNTLDRINKSGLTLNTAKCIFRVEKLTFFGHEISARGVSPTEDRVRALRKLTAPLDAKELISFLSICGYSAKFAPEMQAAAAPLRKLLGEGAKWKWTQTEDEAFKAVKASIEHRSLAFFNVKWHTELIVDASPIGLSAVLAQVDPENKNVRVYCNFASKLLSREERAYSQCEKEALAAVWGCERLWVYLIGHKFTLVTDNRAVNIIFNNTAAKPPARIERWALRLTQFDFHIVHRPGKSNVADYFSRHPIGTAKDEAKASSVQINMVMEAVRPKAISMAELVEATKEDEDLQQLWRLARMKWNRAKAPAGFQVVLDRGEVSRATNGVLMRGQRIIIPRRLRPKLVKIAHKGHQGIEKSKKMARWGAWYPGIDTDIEREVASCVACQALTGLPQHEPQQPTVMPNRPMEVVAIDYKGVLKDGSSWLSIVCEYSRFLSVYRVASQDFLQTSRAMKKFFFVLGVPEIIKSDNGPVFASAAFANMAKEHGFRHRKVTPYHPRANGAVEATMKGLGKVIRVAEIENRPKEEVLEEYVKAYNSTPHSATGVPPAILMLNQAVGGGIPWMHKWSASTIGKWHRLAKQNDAVTKARTKRIFDGKMKLRDVPLKVGEKVLVYQKMTSKSAPRWGPLPATIVEVKDSMVTVERNGVRSVRNACQLKRLIVRDDILSTEPVNANQAITAPPTTGIRNNQSPNATTLRHEPTSSGDRTTSVEPGDQTQRATASLSDPARTDEKSGEAKRAEPARETIRRNRGRPTKADQAIKDKEDQEAEAEKARRNPRTHEMRTRGSSKKGAGDSSALAKL